MKKNNIVSAMGSVQKKVLYAQAVYGEEEKKAVLASLDNKWLASGPLVKQFEEKIAKLFGKKYGIAVNSGSSANLLLLGSLGLPKGSEIITPAMTFATTVAPIIQNGFIPVFVDCLLGRNTIDEDLVEGAISRKTKAIMVPHLIGGVVDLRKLREIAEKYKLFIIEDSCDTLAPSLGNKQSASYADATTTSFYGSHIITALGMGGMILTDSEAIRDSVITKRDWGRVGNDSEAFEKRFDFTIDSIPYDGKFLYGELGYNMKLNEAAAAFGLEQLKRLSKFLQLRERNFTILTAYFAKYEKWFYLPYLLKDAKTNWLAFPLTIKKEAPFNRYEFLEHLEKKGIQTRVMFSGNITRHPIYKKIKYRVASSLKNSDTIMASGFLLGCHQGLDKKSITLITNSAEEFLSHYR